MFPSVILNWFLLLIKPNFLSLSQKFGWGRDKNRDRERVWYLGPDWKGGSRNLDGADTSDDTEIKWDKEIVASTTIGFVKLHFPYISSHLSLSSLKAGDRIKNIKEKKMLSPCSKKTKNKEREGEREGLLESISFLWALKCSDIKPCVLIKKPCVYRCDIFIHTPQDFKDFRRFPWWI